MTEFDIKQALSYQLGQFLLTYPIDVVDSNITYTPVNGISFLEIFFIPGDKFQREFGTNAQNRISGIYQIDINIESNKGEGEIKEIVDALDPFFRRGTHIIYTNPDLEEVRVTIEKFYLSRKVVQDNPNGYSKVMNVVWRSDILN